MDIERGVEEKRQVSNRVWYEIWMLSCLVRMLTSSDLEQGHPVRNGLIESFAIRVRSLSDFLYEDKPNKPNDALAIHFVRDPDMWILSRGAKPPDLGRSTRTHANMQVAHITYEEQCKAWDFGAIWRAIRPAIQLFIGHQDEALLGHRWQDYGSPLEVGLSDQVPPVHPRYRT